MHLLDYDKSLDTNEAVLSSVSGGSKPAPITCLTGGSEGSTDERAAGS